MNMRNYLNWRGAVIALAMAPLAALAQQAPATPKKFAYVVLGDQQKILGSPRALRPRDLKWLLPLGGASAFLFVTDARNMRERVHTNPLAQERSQTISNAGMVSIAALPVLLAWRGWRQNDEYTRDTAVLAVRAVADTLIVAEGLRAVTRRERPGAAGGAGDFQRASVTGSSFPSMHAAAVWAMASAIARRHPGWLTKAAVYGLAGAVTASRVTAGDHFPSDAMVGSALGWMIGRYVGGHGAPPSVHAAAASGREKDAAETGSSYVPMDQWIYVALDRLAALGIIPSQISGLRPWTRAECLRQTREAARLLPVAPGFAANEAAGLVRALRNELEEEGRHAGNVTLESVYVRNGVVAGPALDDGFHFGETWRNDSGRPVGRGWNAYGGFSVRAESGAFFAYVNGEYQRAPRREAYSPAVRQAISQLDGVPVSPEMEEQATSRFRAIDAYAGARAGNFEFSVGKQTLWWGPTQDSPLSFGNNAEPTKNFKISTVRPMRLPGVLGVLGEIRGEFVIGKLGGHQYTWRPWFNAQKLSFKLTENLEVGFTRWSIFWGVGHPITARSFIRNFSSWSSPLGPSGVGASDPGDRKGGFDFRYRIPGLRDWLTLYSDAYSDDDPSPLAAPRHAALNPGIYLTHWPGIARLDLRVEAPSTTPMGGDRGGSFIYYNSQYRSGNTNYGNLLGNAAGRDARAIQVWSTYRFSARDRVELGWRQLKGGAKFLPGGATQSDGTVKVNIQLARDWSAEAFFQYERFWIPLLGGPRRNLSGWIQFTWEPNLELIKRD
jgi:membrane-associated phospholipid phosphatase